MPFSSCGSSRNSLFNVNNTLGKMIGYISDPNIDEKIINENHEVMAINSPDLRRVRNVNIMLVDYKAYAYVPNSNQINPAPKNKALKTPFYFSEVVVDTTCDGQEIAVDQIEALSGNGRNLTENQI